MRKLLSLVFASAMVFALAMPVFASGAKPDSTKTTKTHKTKTHKTHKTTSSKSN